jgi:uncharacterized protein YndB with AHSA1/START domain
MYHSVHEEGAPPGGYPSKPCRDPDPEKTEVIAVDYEVSVKIEAAPEEVWSILEDVERWPQWTPTMTSVRRLDDGPFRVGSKVRVRQPRLAEATWQVTGLEPGQDFTWESAGPGVRTRAGHRVTGRGNRASTLILSIHQHGPMAALLRPFIAGMTRRYVDLEAASLKRHCERPTTRP